jgi:hypothetical protein
MHSSQSMPEPRSAPFRTHCTHPVRKYPEPFVLETVQDVCDFVEWGAVHDDELGLPSATACSAFSEVALNLIHYLKQVMGVFYGCARGDCKGDCA